MSAKSLKTGGFAQPIYKQSVTQMEELDTIRYGAQGRVYAYSRAGAAALAVGKVTQSAVPLSTSNRETVAAAAAVGDTSVSVTFGTAVTADYYKDGFIYDALAGDCYRVKSHAAGTTAVTVYLRDSIRVAWTTNSKATAIQNRQDLVVIAPSTLTSQLAGVPPIAVDINYYFWNQVKGPATVLYAGTLVIGNPCAVITTNGAVGPLANTDILPVVGTVMSVDATTEYGLVNLHVPGY